MATQRHGREAGLVPSTYRLSSSGDSRAVPRMCGRVERLGPVETTRLPRWPSCPVTARGALELGVVGDDFVFDFALSKDAIRRLAHARSRARRRRRFIIGCARSDGGGQGHRLNGGAQIDQAIVEFHGFGQLVRGDVPSGSSAIDNFEPFCRVQALLREVARLD